MKCYVIKNKEGKYLSIASQNYEHYWTTLDFAYYFRFLPNVDAKELADDFKNSRYPDCEVVEITIAEGDLQQQLAEKDKEIDILTVGLQVAHQYGEEIYNKYAKNNKKQHEAKDFICINKYEIEE